MLNPRGVSQTLAVLAGTSLEGKKYGTYDSPSAGLSNPPRPKWEDQYNPGGLLVRIKGTTNPQSGVESSIGSWWHWPSRSLGGGGGCTGVLGILFGRRG